MRWPQHGVSLSLISSSAQMQQSAVASAAGCAIVCVVDARVQLSQSQSTGCAMACVRCSKVFGSTRAQATRLFTKLQKLFALSF